MKWNTVHLVFFHIVSTILLCCNTSVGDRYDDYEVRDYLLKRLEDVDENQGNDFSFAEIFRDHLRDLAREFEADELHLLLSQFRIDQSYLRRKPVDDVNYLESDNSLLKNHGSLSSSRNRVKAKEYLNDYQQKLHTWRRKAALAEWNKETNLTKHNIDASKQITLKFSKWVQQKRKEAERLKKVGLTYDEKRMLKLIIESSALKEDYLRKRLVGLEAKISEVYSKAQVCNHRSGKCYHFEPGLIKLMKKSRNYDELLWAWRGWRDAIGPKTRADWTEAKKLQNKGARENGYADTGEYLRSTYETPSFEADIDNLWRELQPHYKQLHAYVRGKLHSLYGDRVSLKGDMWAMKWDALLDVVEPYPNIDKFAVTKGMLRKNMSVHDMFVLADDFYRGLGLPKMTEQFWNYSMFTRPEDHRPVVCYASAHNLEGDDVRVKMCAAVTAEYLYVVHHEMGHCQYYLAYNRHQPEIYQSGANHGFHEAIGDTAALSVISPTHLQALGILPRSKSGDKERQKKDLNFLMQKALGKLAFYPFALTMAKWSWDVASGVIPYEEMNAGWWRYREKYQGITPPVERTENDFDPACKYHIANFVPYVRYFVSHILQFQFFEALCDLAQQDGPLHRCDFAGSTNAGQKFKEMLQMGQSKPWPYAMEVLTGTRSMSAKPVIRYFRPLLKWLEEENERLGNHIGW